MAKEMTVPELYALAEQMQAAFDTVSVTELQPEELNAPLQDDGLRVDYELRSGCVGCVLTRRVEAEGRIFQLRMTAPLTGNTLPEEHMSARERELCRDEMNHDFLSGVYNRRYLETELAADLEQWKAEGRSAAVALVSLDHFSTLRKAHGQPTMDEVICSVANRWKKTFWQPRERVVCRLTGSVFVVGCADCTGPELEAQMRQLYSEMPGECVTSASGMLRRVPITLSIACGGLEEVDGPCWKELYSLCDSRVRTVGQNGGNAVYAIG